MDTVRFNPSLWLAVVPVILYDRPTPPCVGGEGLSKLWQNHLRSPYYTSQLLGLYTIKLGAHAYIHNVLSGTLHVTSESISF